MLTIPRSGALRFRQILNKSVMADQFRSAWPTVLCQARRNELVLEAGQGGMAVRLYLEAAGAGGAIAFRGDLLPQIDGKDDEPVILEAIGPDKGVARWTDAGVPKAVEFDSVPPEHARAFPDEPRLTAMPETFLSALAEAVRTVAKTSTVRVGLTRILLQGKGGEIAGTNGQQLLIQRGFPFPWEDDVLIPRVAALDGRPLGTAGPVGIGRTETHVVLRVAPWAFALPIDTENIFPGIEAVIPRASAAGGRLQLDPEEAARLAAVLPRLPGAGDEQAPVTVGLSPRPAVRAKGEADAEAVEVVLDRSTATGPIEAVVLNRTYLLRALALGFTEIQVSQPTRPVCCRDRKRIYVFMPLEPSGAVQPGPRVRRVPLPATDATSPPVPRKRVAVSPVESNGHAASPVPAIVADSSTDRVTVADVIGEAVCVAGLLRDAAGRVTRLVAALRRQRHQTRAVQQAMRSLKQLQLVDH
jgi:hypothetical protein